MQGEQREMADVTTATSNGYGPPAVPINGAAAEAQRDQMNRQLLDVRPSLSLSLAHALLFVELNAIAQRTKLLSSQAGAATPQQMAAQRLTQGTTPPIAGPSHSIKEQGPSGNDFLPGGLPTGSAFTKIQPLRKSEPLQEISESDQKKLKGWIEKVCSSGLIDTDG